MKDKFAVSMFGQKRLSREGGIEIVVKELSTRMARDGCQVTCYNRSGHHVSGAEYDKKTEYDGICQKFVPTIERKGLAAVSSSFFAALYSAFGKYDIVHSHELFHSGMVLLTAKLAGVKHRFVHAHNWSDDDGSGRQSFIRKLYNSVMRKWILRYGTEFCACSTLAGEFLYGEKKTHDEKYHLIFNSVDTSKFIENFDKIETGEYCDKEWTNVIQVGRFSPIKNQLFTAEIARELKLRGKKIRILCVGNNGNEYEQQVREAIKKYGIEEHMLLLGVRKDIDVLMRKARAFLLPSLYEGMPLVMIEAQAAGLPCITADTYSHEVDFGIGYVNWMKLNQSYVDWANAIEAAVKMEHAEKQKVQQAIEKNGFDSRVFARRLCDLYEQAMERTSL